MTYTSLRNRILKHRPDISTRDLDLAYEFAKRAHAGQKRYSGEAYIVHPVEVAAILLDLNPDLPALQAALLHDVTEDTTVKLSEIEAVFGKEVAGMVAGLEKLAIVKVRQNDVQEEKWKKMFLAMAKDVRIVFIKLADRLHNMRTLQHVPAHKRERIARETLGVHAAIASRLGIYKIKSELEDLCFQFLYPEEFKSLHEKVYATSRRSEEYMSFAISQLEQLLMRENVETADVQGRMKHLWSIYQKLQRKDTKSLEDIYDLFAVRIILPDSFRGELEQVAHVYYTLGLLHAEYIPLQDRFKDYIAVPKPNGYRSLHSTVLGLGGELYGEPTEVQIRTLSMHKEAELGIASHWSYKSGKKINKRVDRKIHFALQNAMQKIKALVKENPDIESEIKAWLERYQYLSLVERKDIEKQLKELGISEADLAAVKKGRSQEVPVLHSNIEDQIAWLRGLAEDLDLKAELDLYPDRIFVLTPKQKVIELPLGSNPIDFAFAVHTEVGNKMAGSKVNGRIVPFDYELKNGEVVEIITRTNAVPNRYWIAIAKTPSARSKIKSWLSKQDKSANLVAPRDAENREMGGKAPSLSDKPVPEDKTVDKTVHTAGAAAKFTNKVLVTGEENLPVILSACCKPRPPHPIIGYVTRGQFIRIHRQNCRELSGLEGQRFVSAHWKT